jgi:uncharacterized phage protein (TIGR02220 family)
MEEENQNNEKIDILDFNKKVGFIMIPNVLFSNLVKLNIKPYEYLLLSSLYYFAHQNDSAYPAQKTLERLTGVTQRHIRRLFNSLTKKGYITKTRRRSKEKGNKSNIYSFKPLNNILERIITEDLIETQKNNNTLRTDCPHPTEQKSAPLRTDCPHPTEQKSAPLRTDCPPKNTYLEEYTIKNTKLEEDPLIFPQKEVPGLNETIKSVINYLNQKTGKDFKLSTINKKYISARLKEGFTEQEFKMVIDNKTQEWLNDTKMNQYLCPITLFRPENFERYLNTKSTVKKETNNKYKNLNVTHFNPDTGETWVAGGE